MNSSEAVEFAEKYVTDMLSFFGVNTDVTASLSEDVIEVSVSSTDSNSLLIGRGAETLRSMQLLVSSALRSQNAEVTRVNLDIADYKKQRAEKVADQAREWIEEVRSTGDTKIVSLNAADRRVVHHVAGDYSDIKTYSEGEGRDRKLVIAQQSS
jgi:spoIIIJ-associated protein